MRELEYPFHAGSILKNKKALRRALMAAKSKTFLPIKIAILGGVTTNDIKNVMELFLLDQGIAPTFYESEYDQYYEDGMFHNQTLEDFAPDIIYICTSIRNIRDFPELHDAPETINDRLAAETDKFRGLWDHLAATYRCPIIQNDFEYPYYRLLGNRDASDIHGRVNFVTRLNLTFYEYAQTHENFYICDLNYISAAYGLDQWSAPYYWHMYKYAVAVPAIPYLAQNVANIIKSLCGKNKKVLNLDLDNTLWGGVVGDDGADNIEIGQETPIAQLYSEFQEYIKAHKQLGVLLTVNSKNEEAAALSGLARPDSVLHQEDFVAIKANWEPKSQNLLATAQELALLPESFVFVDDNPAEQALVTAQVPGAAVPDLQGMEHYIQTLDKNGYFEATILSQDDLMRTEMYQENAQRSRLQAAFANYEDYLRSLGMQAEIQPFSPVYMARIAQLTNKSNQFNLTTKRYTQNELETVAADPKRITLYGKLRDRFGDNGVVSVVIGRIGGKKQNELHIELWLMSCRVLKRGMEFAMMDALVEKAQAVSIEKLVGYYYPTVKNAMVKDFYAGQGFALRSTAGDGSTVWEFDVTPSYQKKQEIIIINSRQEKGKQNQ